MTYKRNERKAKTNQETNKKQNEKCDNWGEVLEKLTGCSFYVPVKIGRSALHLLPKSTLANGQMVLTIENIISEHEWKWMKKWWKNDNTKQNNKYQHISVRVRVRVRLG